MRADLIDPKAMKSFAEAKDMEEFLELLSQTQYGEDIGEAGEEISAMTLERAFYQRLIKRLDRIIRVAPTGVAEFLRTYYHMRLEIQNLKRILRGKFSKMPYERIKRVLIPISPYLSADFDDLARAETMEDSVRLLEGTVYTPIKESLMLSEEYDVLWPVEARLNPIYVETVQRFLSKIPREDREMVRRIIGAETDVENLLLAINWRREVQKQHSLPPLESVFQLTHKIPRRVIEELIASEDISSAVKVLGAPYAQIAEPIVHDDVTLVRTNLRRYVYEEARAESTRNDFGFPCIMSYLVSCEVEKGDLVGIAWAKEQEVEPETMLKYTVIPAYAA